MRSEDRNSLALQKYLKQNTVYQVEINVKKLNSYYFFISNHSNYLK